MEGGLYVAVQVEGSGSIWPITILFDLFGYAFPISHFPTDEPTMSFWESGPMPSYHALHSIFLVKHLHGVPNDHRRIVK